LFIFWGFCGFGLVVVVLGVEARASHMVAITELYLSYVFCLSFFFLPVLEFELRALGLLDQAFYYLSHSPSSFVFNLFFR
jgi:hypothetical protein